MTRRSLPALKRISPRGATNRTVDSVEHRIAEAVGVMKLLGHESMATSQRCVIGAGSETKAAAAQNPDYHLAGDPGAAGRSDPGNAD